MIMIELHTAVNASETVAEPFRTTPYAKYADNPRPGQKPNGKFLHLKTI